MKNPAMDALSRKLAQYCESAHTQRIGDTLEFAPSLRVIKLRAEYTVDLNGKLWHTHCSSVVGQEMAAPAPDPVQQAAASVQMAAEAEGALRKLLRMAANRGVRFFFFTIYILGLFIISTFDTSSVFSFNIF